MKHFIYKMKGMVAAAIISATVLNSSTAFAMIKLYDDSETTFITKGVTYTETRRLTDEGWMDIYVIKAAIDEEHIRIGNVESAADYGLKETVQKLITDNGAVAGANASFFGMTGTYSSSFGPAADNGKFISVGSDINAEGPEYATLILKDSESPFINYVKTSMTFKNNGEVNLEVGSLNKVSNMNYPVCFNRDAAESTASLDGRFTGLVKIVVENNYITKISAPGETVATPENGYLIIISEAIYENVKDKIAVGQTAEFTINTSVDFGNIEAAISGAGRMLENGVSVSDGTIIKGRQPRTGVGISQDGKYLILAAVDGRGTSIGATHEEMTSIMREFGAYNAMHLDGGGSTTLVAKESDEDVPTVKNNVSDGAERRVINAIGIYNDSQVGQMTQLIARTPEFRGFAGTSIDIEVFGYDQYLNKINVDKNALQYTVSGNGEVVDGKLNITGTGQIDVGVSYNGTTAACSVLGMQLMAIRPNINKIKTTKGNSVNLSFVGVSSNGYEAPLYGVTVETGLGVYENGVFTATNDGAEYMKCSWGGVTAYIPVSIGGEAKAVNSFEDENKINFSTYPSAVTGASGYSDTAKTDGNKSVTMRYKFGKADTTQAAYADFEKPIEISGEPSSVILDVYGNNSGHWLRGRILDKNDSEYVIDFTKNIDFEGWKTLSASIPPEVSYPIRLETVYIAALSNEDESEKRIYFDNLKGTFPVSPPGESPIGTALADSKNIPVGEKTDDGYFINIIGDVTFSDPSKRASNYDSARAEIVNKLKTGADTMIYGNNCDISAESGIDTIKWVNGYAFYEKPNVSIVQMTARNGGLRESNSWQWQTFKGDVLNSANKNILFVIDKTPSEWSDKLETELFRDILEELTSAGKNIMVVSSGGFGTWNTIKNGVRYVNIPGMWYPTGNLNKNLDILKIKATAEDMIYEISPAY